MAESKNKTKKTSSLRITAKREGFRRAGRQWHGVAEVPVAEFNKKQLAALKAEPMLVVEEIAIEAGE